MLALLIITHGDGELGLELAFVTFIVPLLWLGLLKWVRYSATEVE